jgi:hypothetical protein
MMRETASQFAGASLERVTIQDNADISMTIEFYSAGNDERCGPRRFRFAVSMAFASSQIEPATVAVYRGNPPGFRSQMNNTLISDLGVNLSFPGLSPQSQVMVKLRRSPAQPATASFHFR